MSYPVRLHLIVVLCLLGFLPAAALAQTQEQAEAACNSGNADSCWLNGVLLQTVNLQRAAVFFQRACEGGHATGCRSLGEMYRDGRGVDPDAPRAALFFQRACDGAIGPRCTALGRMLENGDGIGLNPQRAAQLFQHGCDLNDAHACAALGSMYQDGRGVQQNREHADALFKRACDIGDPNVCRGRFPLRVMEH